MANENVSERLKSVQKEIIIEIDRICSKYNIRYYLAYGTLIGAIRHNGFIPWDDDLDIMMPYSDMLKFEELVKEEIDTDKFFYQSPQTDSQYRLTINRVRRNGTILLEPIFKDKNVHKGVFVDIYPMYGAAPEGNLRKEQVAKAKKRALYLLDEPVKNHGLIMKLGSKALLMLKSKKAKNKYAEKLFTEISMYDFDESENVTALDSGTVIMSTNYKSKWFGEGELHKFEDLLLRIPNDADSVLRTFYGDYMQLPPENERVQHHNYLEIKLDI